MARNNPARKASGRSKQRPYTDAIFCPLDRSGGSE